MPNPSFMPTDSATGAATHTVDPQRKWWILVVVSAASFLGSVDGSVVNLTLPTLMKELNADFPTTQWVILAYLLGLTVLMPGMGRLADMTEKRRIFAGGLIVFLGSSILCAAAPNIYWLIAFRFVQSIGAAMMLPLSIAIITATWPARERGMAIGIASGVISFGIVFGPAVGGFLLEWGGWRWIFFVNIPIGLLTLLLIRRYVPRLHAQQQTGETFDWLGGLLLGSGLLAFSLALTTGQNRGFLIPGVIALFAATGLSIVLFIRRENRVDHPMVDLKLFRSTQFSLNLFVSWLVFVAISGIVFLLPFYLELVVGLTLRNVGLMMAAVPMVMGVLQPFSGALSDRLDTRPVIMAGLTVMALGYLAMATLSTTGTMAGFAWRLLPVAVGIALFHSPNNSAIMGAAEAQRLGVASGLLSMTRTLAQMTGIALLGAFFNGRLRHYYQGPVNLRQAPVETIVWALRDQFLLVAALMVAGMAVSAILWRREQTRARSSITRAATTSAD